MLKNLANCWKHIRALVIYALLDHLACMIVGYNKLEHPIRKERKLYGKKRVISKSNEAHNSLSKDRLRFGISLLYMSRTKCKLICSAWKKNVTFFLRFHSLKKLSDVDILKATAQRLLGSFFPTPFLWPRANGRISNWCCHWAPTNIHRSWRWCTTPSNRNIFISFFSSVYEFFSLLLFYAYFFYTAFLIPLWFSEWICF